MYQNIGINWAAFQYIFSSNPQAAFELLSYQLFCFEFHQQYGIFRYFNQPNIETMPIKIDNDIIGFQAKYYDAATILSEKKTELKKAISGAKKNYPGINKIIFYINKEPGMSTKAGEEKPSYIEEIETHGLTLGICVEWRGFSQFEIMLFRPELAAIRDYFFNPDRGIRNYLSQINLHSRTIFSSIASEILLGGETIKIERESFELASFLESSNNFLLIHGVGGSGKSGLIKDNFQNEINIPVFIFRATDFETPSIAEFSSKFGVCTFEDFLTLFDEAQQKICIIDSAEKVFVMNHRESFSAALQLLIQHNWKIIITIRTEYKDAFINSIIQTSEIQEYEVKRLTPEQLSTLEASWGLCLPTEPKLRDFICNLFYLKLYLSKLDFSTSESVDVFRKRIWYEIICNSIQQSKQLNNRRGESICKIVLSNANEGMTYYNTRHDDDRDAIEALKDSNIIEYDDTMGGYYITHDVYEEIVLKHIINFEYCRRIGSNAFFNNIGNSLTMRKAFRMWQYEALDSQNEDILRFACNVLSEETVEPIWKDEILIALMSNANHHNLKNLDFVLSENQYNLFFRAMFLLNTSCRVVDSQLFEKILSENKITVHNLYRFTKPSGAGWDYMIGYVNNHKTNIQWDAITIMLVVDVLHAWSRNHHDGDTARNTGQMALYLYQLMHNNHYSQFRRGDNKKERVMSTILYSAPGILSELSEILETVTIEKATDHRELYHDLCHQLLRNLSDSHPMCRANPELVIRLAKCFWLKQNDTRDWMSYRDIDYYFGLNEYTHHDYYPSSALQTPIFPLLQAAPLKTMDFIIELIDQTTMTYENSPLNEDYCECGTMDIIFPNGSQTTQTVSGRLWMMHRGTSTAPHLLESVLMALEQWLYFWIPQISEEVANKICVRLLSKSHSAAITSVIVSMVTAYPDKLFNIACILLHTKTIFLLDINRLSLERGANFLLGLNPRDKEFEQERIRSNAFSFRKKRLEDVILEYQLGSDSLTEEAYGNRLKELYRNIDASFANPEDLKEDYQFVFYRIDIRKMKFDKASAVDIEGKNYIPLVSDLPNHLIQIQNEHRKNTKVDHEIMELFLWSHSRYEDKSEDYKKHLIYEENPKFALAHAEALTSGKQHLALYDSIPIYVSAVLLRDFQATLNDDEIQICIDILAKHLLLVVEQQSERQAGDGTDVSISMLPYLMTNSKEYDEVSLEKPMILLLMFLLGWGTQRDLAVFVFREKIYAIDLYLSTQLLTAFITLKPSYDKEVFHNCGISPVEFFNSNQIRIKEIFKPGHAEECSLDIGKLDFYALQTLSMLIPAGESKRINILLDAGAIIWTKLFAVRSSRDRGHEYRDYKQEYAYITWLAEYLLCSDTLLQHKIVQNLAQHIEDTDQTEYLLCQIIKIQDSMRSNISFWNLWSELFGVVEGLCEKEKANIIDTDNHFRYYGQKLDKVVTTYALAFPWWAENIKSWHTIAPENVGFFSKFTKRLGYHPCTLYSIARVLNTIGFDFLDQGIDWLAVIVRDNPHLVKISLQVNTEYYIEEYMQRFITSKRIFIKRNPELRAKVIDVLSFLVDRGSTFGYMLRESIC